MRRRFLLVLAMLLVMTTVVFLEDRLQAMVPQLAVLAESRLEEMLKGTREISIGSIRGGILRDLELGEIEIKSKAGSGPLPIFKIDRINTGFRVWGCFAGRNGWRGLFKPPDPYIDVKINSGNSWLSGLVRLEGSVDDAKARGALHIFDKKVSFALRGMLTADKIILKDMTVRDAIIPDGEIDFGARTFEAQVRLNHSRVRGVDVVSDISLKGKFWSSGEEGEGIVVEAIVEASKVIINQKPFDDIRLSFKIEKSSFLVTALDIGQNIHIKGNVSLKAPAYPIDAEITANNVNITHVLSSLRAPDITVISGILNAKAVLKGRASRPDMKCRLDIRRGNLGEIYFKSLSADLSGIGSAIRIEDSRINTDKGHLSMIGDFDLRDMGKRNIFADISILTYDRNVVMDGWDIMKKETDTKVAAVKSVSDTVNVGFRTSVNDEKLDPRDRTSQFELGYKMFESDMLNLRLDGEGEFVGVEHKEKF